MYQANLQQKGRQIGGGGFGCFSLDEDIDEEDPTNAVDTDSTNANVNNNNENNVQLRNETTRTNNHVDDSLHVFIKFKFCL